MTADEIAGGTEAAPSDDGCEWHSYCLACPFPECKYMVGGYKVRRMAKENEAMELWRKGKTVEEIAQMLGVSKRTAQRRLHRLTKR